MRLVPFVAGAAGLALIATLVAHAGLGAVASALFAVGWLGFGSICLIHLVLIAVMGIAWWALLPRERPWALIWGRLIRDSGAEVLPLSQVGGFVLGARAAMLAGVSGTAATASTIVDVTLELFAQLAYTALALLWLVYLHPETQVAVPVAAGLGVAAALTAGFVVAQRRGFDLAGRLAQATGRGWADRTASGAAALHSAIGDIYRGRVGLLASFALHFSCWLASALEIWLALRFAGAPLDFGAVLVIESLLYAARSVAFVVPNSLGVQEAAYILLGAGFGMTPQMALALSLLKRSRDLVIGLPALAVWQLAETGRLWRRTASGARRFPAAKAKPRSV
ncbi:MAG TPA: lysylphosphatidylglycerol synthase domain-containing protein [Stellaceae bacterium]